MIPQPEYPSFKLIVRGIFRFPNGRALTRTVTREILGDPTDEERTAIAYQELLEELNTVGYSFREGKGIFVGLLGVMIAR